MIKGVRLCLTPILMFFFSFFSTITAQKDVFFVRAIRVYF